MKKQTKQLKQTKQVKQKEHKKLINNILFHLGNFLIIGSLLGFTFIFYPFAAVYFSPPTINQAITQKGNFITIPSINAQAEIIQNVDPWDESVYDKALEKGVAHAKGTAFPGQKGTSFLFAHSSGMPWEMTRMNTLFLRLGELKTGDQIVVTENGKKLSYKVREMKEVDPSQVHYLLETNRTQLILQTCTPIGTSLRRLLVFADPV